MGWFDKLKDWAEDKLDDVEDELGDAGNWLKDKAEDIAGDNPWANKIIDKIDEYVPSAEQIVDKATDAATDYVGGEIKGTWAEDAVNTVKETIGGDAADGNGDGGGWFGKVTDYFGDKLEGTWAEDAVNKVKDVIGGDDAVVDTAAAGTRPLGPEASTTTAADLGDISKPAPVAEAAQAAAGDVLGTGIVPPAMEAVSMPAPAMDTPAMDAPAMDAVQMPDPVMDAPAIEAVSMPAPEPAYEEPAYEPAPEPTQFESSIAAADQVEASVDDMFADIA